MMFVNETVQAVIMLICEKHAPTLMEKLSDNTEGNWFVLPPAAASQMGYWPHVSEPHSDSGYAVLGFAESVALEKMMNKVATINDDGGICPDCIAYEWNIKPRSLTSTMRDPVCGASVNCDTAFPRRHQDALFFFCSIGCRDKFQSTPEQYVS